MLTFLYVLYQFFIHYTHHLMENKETPGFLSEAVQGIEDGNRLKTDKRPSLDTPTLLPLTLRSLVLTYPHNPAFM